MTERTESERDDAHGAGADEAQLANMLTLEICFLAVVGLVVAAAFVEALSYKLVSSRTPFVIMVPLFVLIAIHARRLFRLRRYVDFGQRLRLAMTGGVPNFSKVLRFSGWMAALLAMITALGHYAGIAIFSFVLIRVFAKERLGLAALVALGTTAAIFCIFEIAFDIELYRGLLFRYFAGYRDF